MFRRLRSIIRIPSFDGRRAPSNTRPGPQELPPPQRGTHYHVCTERDCRNYWVCFKGPECGIGDDFQCRSCEQYLFYAWLEQQSVQEKKR